LFSNLFVRSKRSWDMESILARALEYTLKYWLKSFTRDQFKLQGRTVQLSNLGHFSLFFFLQILKSRFMMITMFGWFLIFEFWNLKFVFRYKRRCIAF
jgi:hypothetical protein